MFTDAELIDHLGGPTKVAKRLGMFPNGVARVSNWKRRGIPARVLLENEWLRSPAPASSTKKKPPAQGVEDVTLGDTSAFGQPGAQEGAP